MPKQPLIRHNVLRFLREEWAQALWHLTTPVKERVPGKTVGSSCMGIHCNTCPLYSGVSGVGSRCLPVQYSCFGRAGPRALPSALMDYMDHLERLIDLERRGIHVKEGVIHG